MPDPIDRLVSASLQRTALEAFRTDYFNRSEDAGTLLFREVHRFHPERDRRFEVCDSPKVDAAFASIVAQAVSIGSKRFAAEGVFDGVSYDCAFDFSGGANTRWILFCPSESDESEIAQLGALLDSLFDQASHAKQQAEQDVDLNT